MTKKAQQRDFDSRSCRRTGSNIAHNTEFDHVTSHYAMGLASLSIELLRFIEGTPKFDLPRLIVREAREFEADAAAIIATMREALTTILQFMPAICGHDVDKLRSAFLLTREVRKQSFADSERLDKVYGSVNSRAPTFRVFNLRSIIDGFGLVASEIHLLLNENGAWLQDIEDWRFWQSNVMYSLAWPIQVEAYLKDEKWHQRSVEMPYVSKA